MRQMGRLYPNLIFDVIPGDKLNIGVSNFLRFAPLISPVMHDIKVHTDFFFIPNRIIDSNWEDWISDQSEAEWAYVTLAPGDCQPGSLGDYLGYTEPQGADPIKMSVHRVAAYCKVWDEYYRAQYVQTTEKYVTVVPGDNPDYVDILNGEPFKRGWMHDYFTSALPFAQKGDAVSLPLTSAQSVPVTLTNPVSALPPRIVDNAGEGYASGGDVSYAPGTSGSYLINSGDETGLWIDPNGSLEVDVNEEAVTINTLRRAFRLQEYLEKLARGGSRYIEFILSMFGVRSSDARLQRPEFFGRASQNMVISEVLSTANTIVDTDITPVGSLAGHGISVGGGRTLNYYCEEYGHIIGIISVMPDTAYQQGVHRSLTREDNLDYANPVFANIGEQEVKLKELFINATATDRESTFGYVPRYAEYKFMNTTVHGEFKTSLNFWHLGRIFSTQPALNSDFIECNPSSRIFAVEDGDQIYAKSIFSINANRKLPQFGTPTI